MTEAGCEVTSAGNTKTALPGASGNIGGLEGQGDGITTGGVLCGNEARVRFSVRLCLARLLSQTARRRFAMANHDPGSSPIGDDVLDAVNEAMVALHERYHGREPRSPRTVMMGEDLLACMLGDVYTDIEKTMIELQGPALVHETRSAFQQAMEHRFIARSGG